MEKKVYFCGSSWGEINHSCYPFKNILDCLYGIEITSEDPDYVFVKETTDSLTDMFTNYKASPIRVFISGEAIVPDFNLFDYAIGFDHLRFNDRYLKIHPLRFFERYLQFGDILKKKDAVRIRERKKYFCDFVYSNTMANRSRDIFFHKLNSYKNVISAGGHLNNFGSELLRHDYDDDWREKKIAFQSQFKFSIAFENALHNGYTTEKLLTPFLAGSVPIYWGNPRVSEFFNCRSFINCHEFSSFDDVILKIIQLDQNEELYLEMLLEPCMTVDQYFKYENSHSEIINFFKNIFDQPLKLSRRRGDGTWNSRYEAMICSLYIKHEVSIKELMKKYFRFLF